MQTCRKNPWGEEEGRRGWKWHRKFTLRAAQQLLTNENKTHVKMFTCMCMVLYCGNILNTKIQRSFFFQWKNFPIYLSKPWTFLCLPARTSPTVQSCPQWTSSWSSLWSWRWPPHWCDRNCTPGPDGSREESNYCHREAAAPNRANQWSGLHSALDSGWVPS